MRKIWRDTDAVNFPADIDEWKKRMSEIAALIPQPIIKERGNNINFVDKAFSLLADCGLIRKDVVEKLNDKNWCDSNISLGAEIPPCKMNPLGGVLRKEGLTMWDKNNLRYYCPPEKLVVPSDIETATCRQFKGASELAVICEGEIYYISNDWFAEDKPRQTKNNFYFWISRVTLDACEKFWKQKNIELIKKQPEIDSKIETDSKILISAKDLNFIINSLKSLNEKVENLTVQVEGLKNLWK